MRGASLEFQITGQVVCVPLGVGGGGDSPCHKSPATWLSTGGSRLLVEYPLCARHSPRWLTLTQPQFSQLWFRRQGQGGGQGLPSVRLSEVE